MKVISYQLVMTTQNKITVSEAKEAILRSGYLLEPIACCVLSFPRRRESILFSHDARRATHGEIITLTDGIFTITSP